MTRPRVEDLGWAFGGPDQADLADALGGFLRSLEVKPRLLGFGEAMHGEESLPLLRNRMFQYLVEREGYRSIALESGCLRGLRVDDFVAGGADDVDEVLRDGFSHGFGESPANRDLVMWMREYNQDKLAPERLRFFGFDAPLEMMSADSPRHSLVALLTYLHRHLESDPLLCSRETVDQLSGDDGPWTNMAAAMDPTQSIGASAAAKELRVITDDLRMLLRSELPRLVAVTSENEYWRAEMYGRTAADLLTYHALMALTTDSRVARMLGVRDTMMADNLVSILDNQAQRGPTFVYAHNRHLQRRPSLWQLGELALRWWPAGAIVGARLGPTYQFVASALGSATGQGLLPPPSNTLEGLLSTVADSRSILDGQRLTAMLGGMGETLRRRKETSTNYSYFGLDPDHLDGADAVVFLKDIPASG